MDRLAMLQVLVSYSLTLFMFKTGFFDALSRLDRNAAYYWLLRAAPLIIFSATNFSYFRDFFLFVGTDLHNFLQFPEGNKHSEDGKQKGYNVTRTTSTTDHMNPNENGKQKRSNIIETRTDGRKRFQEKEVQRRTPIEENEKGEIPLEKEHSMKAGKKKLEEEIMELRLEFAAAKSQARAYYKVLTEIIAKGMHNKCEEEKRALLAELSAQTELAQIYRRLLHDL